MIWEEIVSVSLMVHHSEALEQSDDDLTIFLFAQTRLLCFQLNVKAKYVISYCDPNF